MIVICTKCQAKFRVADDKIGPRGAKVRCSRCQTVFVVQRDPEPVPPAAPAPPVLPAEPGPLAANPFAEASPPPLAAHSDGPFASVFATSPPSPEPDPFRSDDPFGGVDPFAGSDPAPPQGSTLPVTDLSDLLGGPRPAAADPFPGPFEVPADGPPPLPPDRGLDHRLNRGLDGGLALEDRLTPPPMKVALRPEPEAPLEIAEPGSAGFEDAAADTFAAAPAPQLAPDRFDLGGSLGEEPLAAADAGRAAWERAAPAGPEPLPVAPATSEPPLQLNTAPVRAPHRPIAVGPDGRIPGQRGSRVRAAGVNAVALAVLLLVALAILVVWRTEGPLAAGSFRPAALLAALGAGDVANGSFSAQEVASGVYERERGAPLLFVRGKVLSRAPRPVAMVKVVVEVVRAGQVLARGEAIAGAMPTPEELYSAADGAALSRAVRAARARAPSAVRPGDAVPFLVAIGDAPADLEGAAIRLELAPAGRGSP